LSLCPSARNGRGGEKKKSSRETGKPGGREKGGGGGESEKGEKKAVSSRQKEEKGNTRSFFLLREKKRRSNIPKRKGALSVIHNLLRKREGEGGRADPALIAQILEGEKKGKGKDHMKRGEKQNVATSLPIKHSIEIKKKREREGCQDSATFCEQKKKRRGGANVNKRERHEGGIGFST